MAKTKISEFSSTPANNTDIDSINIAEGCAPSNINDAIRELMAQLKDFQTGAVGDSFNGPIGSSTASTGAFTNITASGTLGVTGVATFTAQPIVSSLTASRAVFSDGSKGLVSNAITGTGNVVMSASPTLTGTISAEALTASSSVTLSGGTANGVTYLNGSKVLTSGSALTFDGTNLGVNCTATNFGANYRTIEARGATTTTSGVFRASSSDASQKIDFFIDSGVGTLRTDSNHPLAFAINNTEGMRLTSTGLGIGTSSPYTKLDVSGASGMKVYYTGGTDLNSAGSIVLGDGNRSSNYVGLYRGTSISGGASSNALTLGAYDYIGFNVSATTLGSQTERMRLDSAGNLGLGVTPIGWSGNVLCLQGDSALAFQGANGLITANAYYSGGWKYTTTGAASYYYQIGGAHQWTTAPSGTAGNAISFSQVMTLDASGNLLVGTTSATTLTTNCIVARATQGAVYVAHENGNTGSNFGVFVYDGTTIGSISQSGTTAVLYNTTSDQRLKENIADADSASSLIDSLQVRKFDWKSDGTHQRYGFVAQELVTVAPEAVHQPTDTEEMMAVDYSKLVPMLVKEIQSLRQRLSAANL